MLYAFGVGEIPISVSGEPRLAGELAHTVRAVGAVSDALVALKRGASLGLRGPYGTGWPLALCQGQHVLVVGGGLGLAPLRPAVLQLLEEGACRQLSILYGARTPDDLLFRRDLERWAHRCEVRLTVDRAAAGWQGRVGVVPALLPEVEIEPATCIAFVCGPEVMMRFTARELRLRGLSSERIFLSLERNMKCGIGLCGHCQLGPVFVCKDGPVLRLDRVGALLEAREL
ncbi:MAG: FAD/NAD(P)-binding protein [Deltaproteobacteria bacterium]|nr:FAD/NAD(P)-binding protein [Deltaproteobacteria bacterium]